MPLLLESGDELVLENGDILATEDYRSLDCGRPPAQYTFGQWCPHNDPSADTKQGAFGGWHFTQTALPSTGCVEIPTADDPAVAVNNFAWVVDLGAKLPYANYGAWWDACTADGNKLRVALLNADGTYTELSRDVISFDSVARTGLLRIGVAEVTTTTQKIFIFPSVADQEPIADVHEHGRFNAYAIDFYSHDCGDDRTAGGYAATGTDVTIGGAAGKIGNATDFNGTSSVISFPNPAMQVSAVPYSGCCWVKPVSVAPAFSHIFGPRDSASYRYSFRLEANRPSVLGTSSPEATSLSVVTGSWQFLGFRVTSTETKYWLGTSTETRTSAGISTGSTADANVGDAGSGVQYFDGAIQHIAVDPSELSDEWFAQEYSQTNSNSTYWGVPVYHASLPVPTNAPRAYATVQTPPASQVDNFTWTVDLGNVADQAFWDASTSNGRKFHAYRSDGTRLAVDPITSIDTTAKTGILRIFTSAVATTPDSVWIYPSRPEAIAPAKADTHGQYNAYDSDWRGYWPLDESPPGPFYDRTVNGATGILVDPDRGTTQFQGKLGGALQFDGVSTGDQINTTATLPSANGTMLAWIRPVDFTVGWGICGIRQGDADEFSLITNWTHGNIVGTSWNNNIGSAALTSVPLGTWSHVGGRLNSAAPRRDIFVDGLSKANSTAINFSTFTNVFRIGDRGRDDFQMGTKLGFCEVQLHAIPRSDIWIAQEHLQTDDNAAYWGAWTYGEPPVAANIPGWADGAWGLGTWAEGSWGEAPQADSAFSLNASLDDCTSSSTLTVVTPDPYTASVTLDDCTLASTLTVLTPDAYSSAVTLDDSTLSSSLTVSTIGEYTAVITLDDCTLASTLTVISSDPYTATVSLDDSTLSSSLTVSTIGEYTAVITLDDCTSSSTLTVATPDPYTASVTLDDSTLSSTLTVATSDPYTASVTLDDSTLVSNFTLVTDGQYTLTATLDDCTSSSTLTTAAYDQFSAAVTLDDCTLSSSFTSEFPDAYEAVVTLDDSTLDSALSVTSSDAFSSTVTLDDCTLTSDITLLSVPTVVSVTSEILTSTSVRLTGEVASDGGDAPSSYQFVLITGPRVGEAVVGEDVVGAEIVYPATAISGSTFEVVITGLTPGTTYSWYAQSTNIVGDGDGTTADFNTPVIAQFDLASTLADSTLQSSLVTTASDPFSSLVTLDDSTLSSQLTAVSANSFNSFITLNDSTSAATYSLANSTPTTAITSVTDITSLSALATASYDSGGDAGSTYGFVWSISPNPTLADNDVPVVPSLGSEFSALLLGLPPETTIYVRSYGQNAEGLEYGTQSQFNTLVEVTLGGSVTLNDSTLSSTFETAASDAFSTSVTLDDSTLSSTVEVLSPGALSLTAQLVGSTLSSTLTAAFPPAFNFSTPLDDSSLTSELLLEDGVIGNLTSTLDDSTLTSDFTKSDYDSFSSVITLDDDSSTAVFNVVDSLFVFMDLSVTLDDSLLESNATSTLPHDIQPCPFDRCLDKDDGKLRIFHRVRSDTILQWDLSSISALRSLTPPFDTAIDHARVGVSCDLAWQELLEFQPRDGIAIVPRQLMFGSEFNSHFRLRVRDATGFIIATSHKHIFDDIPTSVRSSYNELIRRWYVRARTGQLRSAVLLKRKRWGERCPDCRDRDGQHKIRTQCITCFDVGFTGGYYVADDCFFVDAVGTNTGETYTVQSGYSQDGPQVQSTFLNIPQVYPGDVWVDRTTDERWVIGSPLVTKSRIGNVELLRTATSARLDATHVVYSFDENRLCVV